MIVTVSLGASTLVARRGYGLLGFGSSSVRFVGGGNAEFPGIDRPVVVLALRRAPTVGNHDLHLRTFPADVRQGYRQTEGWESWPSLFVLVKRCPSLSIRAMDAGAIPQQ